MAQVAHWIHTCGSTEDAAGGTLIDKDELIDFLADAIRGLKSIERYQAKAEAKRFLGFVRERTGLLNEQGQDCYAFVHKTFQEYLTAEEIDYQADNEGEFDIVLNCIGDRLHDAHWREVLLLLIAQQKPKKAAKAIRRVLERGSEYEAWLHRDLLFAGWCLAEDVKGFKGADAGLCEEVLQRLVALEVEDRERVGWRVQSQVFEILCSLEETAFEKEALALLKEAEIEEWRLRQYRAALGERDAVVDSLLPSLRDEDSDVRLGAVEALKELKVVASEKVVDALLQSLSDEDSEVRCYAADTLRKLKVTSEAMVDALLQSLSDENSSVRSTVAMALGELKEVSAALVDTLLRRLADEDWRVRSTAAKALGKLKVASDGVVDALLQSLNDEHSEVRLEAAEALGKMGMMSDVVVNALLQNLVEEESWIRSSAVWVLGEVGATSDVIVNALLLRLADEDWQVHFWAAMALGKLKVASDRVVDALFQSLRDEISLVRYSAAGALGELKVASDEVVDVLLQSLADEDEDEDMHHWAAQALGKLGKQSDVVLPRVIAWIEEHQDSEYLGSGIDALWDLVT